MPLAGDPRRPFVRPLAPNRARPPAAARSSLPPLDIDEALDLHERVAELVQESQLQQAIDLLDDAVTRARGNPALALEMKIELAATLYAADEFTRAAKVFDEIMPLVMDREEASLFPYYAGMSHAEIGELDAAISHLRVFLTSAEPSDDLYRDAKYQLGMMLVAVGQAAAGLAELVALRPILVAAYGEDSNHVRTLDRRIDLRS